MLKEVFEGVLMLTVYMLLGILAICAWSLPCIAFYYLVIYTKV